MTYWRKPQHDRERHRNDIADILTGVLSMLAVIVIVITLRMVLG